MCVARVLPRPSEDVARGAPSGSCDPPGSTGRALLDALYRSLQHLDLPPQNQHLSLKLGLLLPADRGDIQQKADQRIKHPGGHGDDRSNAVKLARPAPDSAAF